jgi:hypothetical protein
VTNIVNVLIHDETAKSQVIEGALKKMNIYRADAIPTAQEIRDKKRLLANGESIDAVKDYSK